MKAGRHRTFDKEIALEQAMEVFWCNGYAGTSLTDLTNAMGINKPSLYSAFGNKEELYKSTLTRYVEKHGIIHAEHLVAKNKSVNDRVSGYLTSIAEMVTDANLPGGCFVCQSTCEVGTSYIPPHALQTILAINAVTKSSLTTFFNNEISAGNITSDRCGEVMANYLISLQFGLAMMAKNKATLTDLNNVIQFSIERL
jgi:AcrR family transcriptional regulator